MFRKRSIVILVIFAITLAGFICRIPSYRTTRTMSAYGDAFATLSALNSRISKFYEARGKLPGCGISGYDSYNDPATNANSRCTTQRFVASADGVYGLDEDGKPMPRLTDMPPIQRDLGIGYHELAGRYFEASDFQYRAVDSGGGSFGYAYAIAVVGSGANTRVPAGTGVAVFYRDIPPTIALRYKLPPSTVAIWERYEPGKGAQPLVLSTDAGTPYRIPMPDMKSTLEEIKKLGWSLE